MRVDLVVVCVAAVSLSLPAPSTCDPLYVMSAPNLLRVGTPDKVFVEAQDYTGNQLTVRISVLGFPTRTLLAEKSVSLTTANNFQELAEIEVPTGDLARTETKYVYLQAQFPNRLLEKLVLISFQTGYIFLQTDKTIYTPSTTVNFRIFALKPDFTPSNSSVDVKIMNPNGFEMEKISSAADMGVISKSYKIPEYTSFGTWSVVASFSNTPQENFTAEFEVKEYVLPSFEISLSPRKTFFYVDDQNLIVDIEARYLYGRAVTGVGFVMFGVLNNNQKRSLPRSLKRVEIRDGKGEVTLQREDIENVFPNMNDIVHSSIYVHISVLTETGGEMVEAEKRGIQIVTSPYTIHFKRTPKYFKPGMPFDVTVLVTKPDGTPAPAIQVVCTIKEPAVEQIMITKDNGIAKFLLNTPTAEKSLKIEAKTKCTGLTDARQASQETTVNPYKSKTGSKNYLHIDVPATQLSMGDDFRADLNFPQSLPQELDLTYMILSKGQIVEAKRSKRQGKAFEALPLRVTKDMVPSFRIVAYYHVSSSEVVSDSVWVDVKDTCMGKLTIERDEGTKLEPKGTLKLKITGDPGTKVGLVAVDKGVYVLNNKHRLTQSKIWDTVEKFDTGCTPGSGQDSMGVFSDAGLVFETNTAGGTSVRTVSSCPSPSNRRRRSVTVREVQTTLAKNYTGVDRQCCVDGMKENILGYSCDRRAEFILDGQNCTKAFLHCCHVTTAYKEEEREVYLQLARSDIDEDADMDEYWDEYMTSRSKFPESWLWVLRDLPNCAENDCILREHTAFPDSITSWIITAVSVSHTKGICVAETLGLEVEKTFFIDLKLPYSAVRHEQIEIKAIIHNNNDAPLKVRVELYGTKDVCSAANKAGKSRTIVDVFGMSTHAVPFVIVPIGEPGKYTIEVRAMVYGSFVGDGVKKDLLVVGQGVRTTKKQTIILDPSHHGGIQRSNVTALRTDKKLPNTHAMTYITVQGDDLGVTIEKAINGETMEALIRQPGGCAEQNMAAVTMPVIAVHYLDKTMQWDKVGVEQRARAIQFINEGHQNQLVYYKPDGSSGVFKGNNGNTWLTAYGAKVFSMASDVISINENVICDSLKWLIREKQRPDGSFTDKRDYTTSGAAMTAFVLIAFQESKKICADKINNLDESMEKSLQYLESSIPKLENPYAAAMVSYALANSGKPVKSILYKFSHEDDTHWPVRGRHYLTLEATAYALLALVKMKEFEKAGVVVNWLNAQRRSGGGYGTTQSTIMVFQAVAEYRVQAKTAPPKDLKIEISSSGRDDLIEWAWTKNNAFATRSEKFDLNEDLIFTARGGGKGTVLVEQIYYVAPIEENLKCENFTLNVTMVKKDRVKEGYKESYLLTIDVQFMSNEDATMTILDVTFLTGFVVDVTDLSALTNGKDRYIQKYEMNQTDSLSNRGSLIIYLDKISHNQTDRIAFKVHKALDVGMLQPAAVTVYEYYRPDHRCVKFYHPEKHRGGLNRLCIGEVCQCAEGQCCKQRKTEDELKDRELTACQVHVDYVIKATILNISISTTTDIYRLRVASLIKKDEMTEGSERVFVAHPSCREKMDLQVNKSYLIMGAKEDVHQVENGYQFVFGEKTWIEYSPTEEEGQEPEFEDRFIGIADLVFELVNTGCSY
ncbi:complement C3-like isoform X2 [Clupea harengus]|uniref:Complement C3-like isoform X2 n=1 Tax=Clupea harengus TaxID=7950 RepID=A0A6P8F0Y3_CLUHA|nr:complement C3-like isoform X2 [Clupea harengus]